MKLHYVRHVHYEGLGRIESWARETGLEVSSTQIYLGESLPEPDEFDFLVVLGGPMGAYDETEFPWLKEEKAWLSRCCEQRKKILGICLGAQLLSEVLGGEVSRGGKKEIGWQNIEKSPSSVAKSYLASLPSSLDVFQWHGDTFTIPEDCDLLFEGDVFKHQGFSRGDVDGDYLLGLQFHFEFGYSDAERLYRETPMEGELWELESKAGSVQSREEALSELEKFQTSAKYLTSLLDGFFLNKEV